jgi:signal transduction histidine kinase
VRESDGELLIEVQDDGAGFDWDGVEHGFGLAGMKERVVLVGGALSIESGERGTLVAARLPARRGRQQAGDRAEWSGSDQAAS